MRKPIVPVVALASALVLLVPAAADAATSGKIQDSLRRGRSDAIIIRRDDQVAFAVHGYSPEIGIRSSKLEAPAVRVLIPD